jgi:2-phosphosulfolactate phosphatase
MPAWQQTGFDVRFDWGPTGLDALLEGGVRTVVVVDVLRFTTAVDVACGRGAAITPYPFADPEAAAAEGARIGAVVARRDAAGGDTSALSLSPVSLRLLTSNDHVVLPSPNGSAIAHRARDAGVRVIAGCLRNAHAVAEHLVADPTGFPVGLVASGERWPGDSLRPAVEDMWGAGAVAASLAPAPEPFQLFGQVDAGPATGLTLSPEVQAAARALPPPDTLTAALQSCASGRELVDKGWSLDVEVAAALGTSRCVPLLGPDGAFRSA